jgi:hypothetical protein
MPARQANYSGASHVFVKADDDMGEDISSEEDDNNEEPLGEATEGAYITDNDEEGCPRIGCASDQLIELGRASLPSWQTW